MQKTHSVVVVLPLLLALGLPAQLFDAERHKVLPNSSASQVIAGDLDGDGDQDLVMLTEGLLGTLEIAWNDGQGRFIVGARSFPALGSAVAAGDVDGDGDLDLAAGQHWFLAYSPPLLLRNDGPSGFVDVSARQWPTSTESPVRIVFLDYDGDGDLDLLTCNTSAIGAAQAGQPLPINRLYFNDGTGFFRDVTAARMPNAPSRNTGLMAGDLDNDGDQDIVVSTDAIGVSPGNCRVFIQNALGVAVETSGRIPAFPGLVRYLDVVLADLDLDGDLDLAAASSQGVLLFANNGAGSFTLSATLADDAIATLHAPDLDLDGRPDLLATRQDQANRRPLPLRLWRNTAGGFVDVTAARVEMRELAPGFAHIFDCDGDGDADLWGSGKPQPTLWHNDGRGRLLQITNRELSNTSVVFAAAADADGDGDPDAAFVEQGNQGNQVSFSPNVDGAPSGAKVTLVPFDAARRPACIAWLDVDLDGDLDLYVGNRGAGVTPDPQDMLFHNTGSGFRDVTATRMPVDPTPTTSALTGDIDRDGIMDVITAGFHTRLHRGDGIGGLVNAAGVLPMAATAVSGVALLDYDGDGDLDLAQSLASDLGQGPLRLLRNDWPAPFADVTAGLLPPRVAWSVATIDVDRDGREDLLFGGFGLWLFRSTGAGFVEETGTRVPPTFETWHSLAVLDIDGDGWQDVLCSGRSVSLPLRNARGVLVPFPATALSAAGLLPSYPAAADFDADGDPDLVVGFGFLRNRTRDLANAVPPRLGFSAELVLRAHAGDGINPQLVSLLLSPALASPAVPLPGLGRLFLDPSAVFVHTLHSIPTAGGEAAIGYAVPSRTVLIGTSLFAQALFLHQPSPATWRLGNAVELKPRL